MEPAATYDIIYETISEQLGDLQLSSDSIEKILKDLEYSSAVTQNPGNTALYNHLKKMPLPVVEEDEYDDMPALIPQSDSDAEIEEEKVTDDWLLFANEVAKGRTNIDNSFYMGFPRNQYTSLLPYSFATEEPKDECDTEDYEDMPALQSDSDVD